MVHPQELWLKKRIYHGLYGSVTAKIAIGIVQIQELKQNKIKTFSAGMAGPDMVGPFILLNIGTFLFICLFLLFYLFFCLPPFLQKIVCCSAQSAFNTDY